MASLLLDLKHALRSLRNSRAFVVVALLTLALGIGANTAAFSVVRGVLLRPLPFDDPEQLVRAWEVNIQGGRMQAAWRNFLDWSESRSFASLAAYGAGWNQAVTGPEGAMRLGAAPISAGFFDVLRPRQIVGRLTRPEDHRVGARPVAVVSERFWRNHMSGTQNLGDRTYRIGSNVLQVVGVVPGSFDFPAGTDIWYPLELSEQNTSRTSHNYAMIGRLTEGLSLERAKADLDRITRGFLDENPGVLESESAAYFPASSHLEPLRDATVGDARRPLWIVLAASTLLLLVACTNLASTSLARGAMREKEIAVRLSLGGSRRQIARLFFVESLLLSFAGGVIGLVIAGAALRLLTSVAAGGVPRLAEVRLDGTVLLFTLVTCVITAMVFGLFPAVKAPDRELGSMLRSAGRVSPASVRERVWSGIVVTEIAMALLLLVGAGLLIRSFVSLLSTDPGYRTEGLLLASVIAPYNYPDADARGRFHGVVLDRVRELPGVADVGLVSSGPLSNVSNGLVQVEGAADASASGSYQVVTSEYFRVMEIPLVSGRLFGPGDHAGAEHVVVVNESFARLAWPGSDPVGRRMTGGGMDNFWQEQRWARVIGVVADTRQESLHEPPQPTYFFPLSQRPQRTWAVTLVLRPRAGNPSALAPAVRGAILDADRNVPLAFSTIEQRIAGSVTDRRFTMLLLGSFAGIGLLLALVGIYGVVSYSVVRRQREIGIRLALGARGGQVRGMITRRVLVLAAIGVVVGSVAAIGATRIMASLLYDVSPIDAPTFVAVALVMVATAWIAGWVPALRSSRVDPLITMRAE